MSIKKSRSASPYRVRAVAFDLDGTLAETLPDLHTATNLALSEIGIGEVSEASVKRYIGKGIEHLVQGLIQELDLINNSIDMAKLVSRFRSHYADNVCEGTYLFPHTLNVLKILNESGFGLACLTNKSKEFTYPILSKLGVEGWFQYIICGDSLAARKPDPLPLLTLADRFGVKTDQVLMIGDSKTDVDCARNAGSPVFCVPYGYRSGLSLADLDCDVVLDSPLDIIDLIERA